MAASWPSGREADLWVHFLESGESRDLTAADGSPFFWSPNSRFIGYPFQGKLMKIEATTPEEAPFGGPEKKANLTA